MLWNFVFISFSSKEFFCDIFGPLRGRHTKLFTFEKPAFLYFNRFLPVLQNNVKRKNTLKVTKIVKTFFKTYFSEHTKIRVFSVLKGSTHKIVVQKGTHSSRPRYRESQQKKSRSLTLVFDLGYHQVHFVLYFFHFEFFKLYFVFRNFLCNFSIFHWNLPSKEKFSSKIILFLWVPKKSRC